MQRIVATKRRLKSRTPFIEWQFLVMKHNEHEIDEARELADRIGVDNIEFVTPTLVHGDRDLDKADAWLSENPRYRSALTDKSNDLHEGACWWLWRAIVVNPDGGVGTCCYLDRKEQDLGSVTESSLEELWNNDYYQSARSLFSEDRPERPIRTACHDCSVVTDHGRATSSN
jgi:radical SAM protein with 4Fe4S-binding SPASM domain